jgi:hypothetical protein
MLPFLRIVKNKKCKYIIFRKFMKFSNTRVLNLWRSRPLEVLYIVTLRALIEQDYIALSW